MPETRALIQREFKRERWLIAAASVALVAVVLVVGWAGDRRSCLRSVPLRGFVIEQVPIDRKAETYWRRLGDDETADRILQRLHAESKVRQLNCGGLLPGT